MASDGTNSVPAPAASLATDHRAVSNSRSWVSAPIAAVSSAAMLLTTAETARRYPDRAGTRGVFREMNGDEGLHCEERVSGDQRHGQERTTLGR